MNEVDLPRWIQDVVGLVASAIGLLLAIVVIPISTRQDHAVLFWLAYLTFLALLVLAVLDLVLELWHWLAYRNDGTLYHDCVRMHDRLMDFVKDRALTEPQMPWPMPADRDTRNRDFEERVKHSQRTQELYEQRFAASVIPLVEALIARGLTDEMGDHMATRPGGGAWTREIALSLKVRAEKLWKAKPLLLRWRRLGRGTNSA